MPIDELVDSHPLLTGDRAVPSAEPARRVRLAIMTPEGDPTLEEWERLEAKEAERVRQDRLESLTSDPDNPLAEVQRRFMQGSGGAPLNHLEFAMTDEELARLPPPEWVVDGWLPRGFYSDLFGEPGTKKTFAILDVVRCVRAGLDWHGHAVQRGSTVFYQGEGAGQLVDRTRAWDSYNENPNMEPGWTLALTEDLTAPEGVAEVIRSVRALERTSQVTVQLVAFDPAVEYMAGDENGEGMESLTRGLRVIAQMLNVAVLVGHHTNASGDRARGSDHMRMRSGAHMKVETVEDGFLGIVQQKQKNGEMRALVLQPVPHDGSLVLHTIQAMSAADYHARKTTQRYAEKSESRIAQSVDAQEKKTAKATQMLLEAIRSTPGMARTKVLHRVTSKGVGKVVLEVALDTLVQQGRVRVEKKGSAPNSPQFHFLGEPTSSE